MRKYFLLFLISLPYFAQSELGFDFDYAQFRIDSSSNYLEIYYSLNQDDFTKINEDGNLLIKALMHIQIQNKQSGELVVNKDWMLEQPFNDDNEQPKTQSLLGIVGFKVKGGSYVLNVSIEDSFDKSIRKEYNEDLEVIPFYQDHFIISDIELASRIITESSNRKSIFYKNTMEIFPNPSILYSNNSPIMFYYAELYNLLNGDPQSKLELRKRLFNSNNSVVYDQTKQINRDKESIVEIGYVNLKSLPTDTYTYILTLTDAKSKRIAASSKKFFLINPDVAPEDLSLASSADYMSSEFGVYLDEECDELFSRSKIIATDKEIDEYDDLDSLNHKREFLYNFWKKRDTNPATEINEYKNAYFARIEIANARFRTMSNPGYKTDRGQVYLKYGEPDEIDRYPNETDSKPYEIWSYNQIEGGVIFVFGDLTGFNYYELLHSTKRGELQDPNWQRRIVTN